MLNLVPRIANDQLPHCWGCADFIAEQTRLELCLGFWNSRKVTGFWGFFFYNHNQYCEWQAQTYRLKMQSLMRKGVRHGKAA